MGNIFISIFEIVIGRCNAEKLEIAAILARNIWLRRNTIVYEGAFKHPSTMLRDVNTSLEEFHKANTTVIEGQ
jgi:hypothetical protein